MAFNVKGKTALVTGAGSGICLEFSKLLLERGCNVLAADLALRPEAEEAFNKYQKGSPRVVFQKTDVADWKQLRAAFDKAVEEFGDLDIVNPGAGTFEPVSCRPSCRVFGLKHWTPWSGTHRACRVETQLAPSDTFQEWTNFWYPTSGVDSDETSSYKIFDLNISHPIRASQLAIDYFKRLHKSPLTGAIVHISSIAAQMPLLPVPLYSASKHAISAFVRSLAPLESVGIRVNAVAPGIVKTPLWTDEKLAWVDDSVEPGFFLHPKSWY